MSAPGGPAKSAVRQPEFPLSDLQPRIRPAAAAEIPALAAVIAAAFAEFATLAPRAAWQAYVRQNCDLAARWTSGHILVAVDGGGIAGTVTYHAAGGDLRMGRPAGWAGFGALAVAPGARRRGIGRALVAGCLDRARADGAPTLAIHTSAPMQAALGLYRREAFRPCPEFDLLASTVVDFDPASGDVRLLALRRDLVC